MEEIEKYIGSLEKDISRLITNGDLEAAWILQDVVDDLNKIIKK